MATAELSDLPPHLVEIQREMEGYARGHGLDFYPTIFEYIDADQLNAVQSVFRHAEESEQLQREAMANGPVDFASSPSLREEIEGIIYTAGEGHQKATNVLLELADDGRLIDILLKGGLHQRLRDRAGKDAIHLF